MKSMLEARATEKEKPGMICFLPLSLIKRTRKVIWVSKSRRKEALDTFFAMIGKAYVDIKVVTCDQHKGYAESVREYCPI